METAQSDPSPPVQSGQAGQVTFGALLRQYRLAAGLSQEELAERAGLSVQGLSALENGRRQAPYRHTVGVLAQALGLSAAETAALAAAVVRARPSAASAPLAPSPSPPPPERQAMSVTTSAALDAAAPLVDVAAVTEASSTALPTGTLTFLLTDIEGSTAFWERYPTAMQAAMARHDALVDEVLARHGGRQVKERGEGDSVLAVFTTPTSALATACALQRALLAELWPPGMPLRVRIGLHSGEAELRGIGYYGLTVNRTARIRSLGHGGQILVSQATADLVRGIIPAGVTLRALGAHRLKGLEQPEEIYQVLHPDLPAAFPALASPVAHPSNLPLALSSLIGREAEQAEVLALLSHARLVTLSGAGGAGKTRLALAVAGELVDQYPDGVWLMELAPLADPSLVVRAVAQTLGLREEPSRALLATLTDHLKEKRLLLVLDNCEHLVAACAALVTVLLRGSPHLRVLATSREGLGVAGERIYRVPSMAAPSLEQLPPPDGLGGYAAVALFVARARERRADFTLTAQNARAVAQVCARLDGLPLAIELAAARVGSLPIDAIAARLDDRFKLLTAGPRTAVPRQQTLRAALDWSYDLLSAEEQRLLDRLSVFPGGCTLEAAEVVCSGVGIDTWEVLDLLGGLVNKSLVLLEEAGQGRYALLETVRQYGWERLTASGEAKRVRDRHLAWCLALAEEAQPQLQGPEQGTWLERLKTEYDNLRTALGYSLEVVGTDEPALRLAGALIWFWYMRDRLAEGRHWLELALGRGTGPTPERSQVLDGAGRLALGQGAYAQAAAYYRDSLALSQALGDTAGVAAALTGLGRVAADQDDHEEADAVLGQALALWRQIGDARGTAECLTGLANLASDQGDYDRAATRLHESLRLWDQLQVPWGMADALNRLGWVAHDRGLPDEAIGYLERSLSLRRVLGHQGTIAETLSLMADVENQRGHLEVARALHDESLRMRRVLEDRHGMAGSLMASGLLAFHTGAISQATQEVKEALTLYQSVGDTWGIAGALELLAGIALAESRPGVAAQLFGAGAALRVAIDSPLPPTYRTLYDQTVAAVRAALGDSQMEAAWAAGRALPLAAAITLALDVEPAAAHHHR